MVDRLDKGFSMIELMLALTIAGILATIGIPQMRNLMLSQDVRAAASDLHLSLLLARSEAVKRSASAVVTRNTAWNNGWSVRVGATNIRSREALTGMTVECSTDSDNAAESCPASVTFQRTGRPTAYTEFRVFVAGNSDVTMRCISISLSGVPNLKVDNDGNSGNGCD
jgi:type IV fimbrial biogenesis protein FimT